MLQLNAAGSKNLIMSAQDNREKIKCLLAYVLKVALTLVFCITVVTLFSTFFGADNSIVGVVMVLAILTFRQTDFGIKVEHSAAVIFMVFGILTVGPHVSNLVGPFPALLINFGCVMAIMILGCHNIIMYNHIIFILCYYLLRGNDVSGEAFQRRIVGMAIGSVIIAVIFYITHKNREYKRTIKSLFDEFILSSSRTKWYFKVSVGIAACVFIAECLSIPRTMWAAFAAMSLLTPFESDAGYRIRQRVPYNILGCIVFAIIYITVPESIRVYVGLLGGIGVGFSATYKWQTMFNSFGALAAAAEIFGLHNAVILRVINNVLGCVIAVLFIYVFKKVNEISNK